MFIEQYHKACCATGGALCVGLDPHLDRIPTEYGSTPDGVREFLDSVIGQTLEHASAYKPNIAFFEALGPQGLEVLARTIERIQRAGRPVILDAKRGDIASTAAAYAEAAFGRLGADAITVVPYMGADAIIPFLERGGFTFVLALPSNASAAAIVDHGSPPLYQRTAELALELDATYPGQLGLVVGATRPHEASVIHRIAPDLPWLVPGIGAQGASSEAFFAAVGGHETMVVNASRAVLFAPDPGQAAADLKRTIQELTHA
ncbi:orotidine-5'-phosphate decarboxylase [Candidatus Bipolaricaulota bacterium]|nr:orotidine-5'-phosphate decarboxylase [Candidatus Bipolaricaulota bacterium]